MRAHIQAGFTIIELLLASLVLILLLGFAAIFLHQGSRVHETVSERSSEQETLDSVSQVLMYDFRLAGYQGPSVPPLPLNQALTATSNGVTIHYALEDDPARPYEISGAQQITYTVQKNILTRCHALATSPGTCIGGVTELAEGISQFTANASALNGYGVTIDLLQTPYGCEDAACATPYSVRIPFPQPLLTGATQ